MEDSVKVEEVNSTEYKVLIQVAPENVDKKFDEFFESIKKQTQVPGFRKGRAPVARIRQYFGKKARPSLSQMLVGEYYGKALQDSDINPVGNPTLEGMKSDSEYPGEFGFDNSYSVELSVEVLPKLNPTGYRDLDLELPQRDSKELFNDKMRKYQEQFAERSQITERGAKLGDALVIDFAGSIDGKPFEGGTAKGFSVESLGKGHFVPGFEDQIIGVMTGETRVINVIFPSEYRAKHLAGKDAKFEVTVQNIVEIKLAKVNEDLAMMVGYESVDELNEHVQNDTDYECRLNDRHMMDHQITTKLLEINEFDAPKSMVEKEQLRLLGNNNLNNIPEQAKEELQKMAAYNVRRALLMDAIYEKEDNIEVTPDELSKMLGEHAQKNNQTKDELVSNLYNTNQMDNFVGVLKLAKVVDFIVDSSKKGSEESNGNK